MRPREPVPAKRASEEALLGAIVDASASTTDSLRNALQARGIQVIACSCNEHYFIQLLIQMKYLEQILLGFPSCHSEQTVHSPQ